MSDAPQLELFDELPAAPRLPRRLRRLGFERQRVYGYIARWEARLVELDGCFAELAAAVSEARARGRVLPDAYSLAIKIDDVRDEILWGLKVAGDLGHGLEQELSVGVERLLAK